MTEAERLAEIVGQWRERADRGEAADPEELVRAHPDLAEKLRTHFAALDLFARMFAPSPAAPSRIGEYRILREIGRGGMGVVYEAEQTSMRRRVALKVLFPSITSSPSAVRRFQQEAWATGRLKHTNIVAVHQLGQERGIWYCAMELVDGRPLSDVIAELRRAGGSPRESRAARRAVGIETPSREAPTGQDTGSRAYFFRVAEVFAGVADALQVAHDHGVIHRDVKPANLLLDAEGSLKLVDFGLARLEEGVAGVTITGEVLGTPLYMSPEQVKGGHAGVDSRTDVYSLGATLYETLTLRPPFPGATVAQVSASVLGREPLAPRRVDRRVPKDLETIVLKAMEKEPARRYRTAGEMARDLRLFVDGAAITARRIGPLGRVWRRARRQKMLSALAAALVVALAVVGMLWIRQRQQEQRLHAERERRLELEYGQLVARAAGAHITGDTDDARELYARAIATAPERPEAFLNRALMNAVHPDGLPEALADVDSATQRGTPPPIAHLARAWILQRSGEEEAAERERLLAGAAPSEDAVVVLFRGIVARLREERAEARRLLDDAVRLAGSGGALAYQARWQRFLLRIEDRAYEAALADALAMEAAGDRSAFRRVCVAVLWRKLDRTQVAQELYEQIRDETTTEEGCRDLCQALKIYETDGDRDRVGRHHRGNWQADAAARAATLFPRNPWFVHVQAEARLRGDEIEEALKLCDQALSMESDASLPHLVHELRATCFLRLERWEDALAAARAAHEKGHRCWAAYCKASNALLSLDRHAEALEEADLAVSSAPRLWLGHIRRALALGKLGRPDEAMAACETAMRLAPREAEVHVARAEILQARGHLAEALEATAKALETWPEHPEIHCWQGQVYEEMGKHAEALESYGRALALSPEYVGAMRMRGNLFVRSARFAEAIAEYDRALALRPDDVNALVGRGAACHGLGQYEECLRWCERALALKPDSMEALTNQAAALTELGRSAEALPYLHRAIAIAPSEGVTRYNLASALFELGRWEESSSAIDAALAIEGLSTADRVDFWALKAKGRAAQGDHAGAAEAYERAVETAGEAAAAGLFHDWGMELAYAGRTDDAFRAIDLALQRDPKNMAAHRLRGDVFRGVGRHAEAKAAYERALGIDPDAADVLNNLAVLLLTSGDAAVKDIPRALAASKHAVELEPSAFHWYTLAGALGLSEAWKEARTAHERAAELAPEHPVVINGLAWLLATCPETGLRDPELAVKHAGHATELAPDDAGVWNTLGIALCRAGEWSDALKALGRSMDLSEGGSACDWFFVAIAQWNLGNRKDARASYERAVAWTDEHAPGDEDLARFRREAAALLCEEEEGGPRK